MNLMHLSDLNSHFIDNIFSITDRINKYYTEILKNRNFVLFFPQESIRSRLTFELGLKQLGANTVVFPASALNKREEIKDLCGYIENWADGIIVRHTSYEKIDSMEKNTKVPIINAMTSLNHPCEILSDLYSIRQLNPDYKKLKYIFVGPPGNISFSWQAVAKILGLNFMQVCPKESVISGNRGFFCSNLDSAIIGSDVVLTDSLPEEYRNQDYYKNYQLTADHLGKASPSVLFNPCPPFYRGEEISQDLIDSPQFVGYDFKKNLLRVHKAIVLFCLGFRPYDF